MKLHNEIKTSISGIRGRYPKQLTLNNCLGLAQSYADLLDSKNRNFVIGRDARAGSIEICNQLIPLLQSRDIKVIDIGLAPLPTTGIAIKHFKAVGGICVTASHNPHPWHGLKLLDKDGEFINGEVLDQLLNDFEKTEIVLKSIGSNYSDTYNDRALNAHLDLYDAKDLGLTIALDCVNNAGSVILPRLVEKLGCTPIELACDPESEPQREYEPNTKNLAWTTDQIKQLDTKVDFGIAVDPDADRLVLLNSAGEVINEEMTLALAVQNMLEIGYEGPIVVNLSTSSLVDHIAEKHDRKVIKTSVGEQNVVNGMKTNDAVIGGEGNGGVIDGTRHYSRDSLSALFHIANLIDGTGKSIDQLTAELPRLHMIKDKIDVSENFNLDGLKTMFDIDVKVDTQDGLRFDFNDKSWVQVRESNTEPIVRIFAEAKTIDRANSLVEKIKANL